MNPLFARMRKSLQNRAVWRDKRGVSAVEFGLLAPVILAMYVGTFEIVREITLDRRVASVASTAADLVAQVTSVTISDLANICNVSKAILDPTNKFFGGSPAKVVLSSVVADQNNNGTVAWSYSDSQGCGGGSPRAPNSSYALPAGTTEPNSSVIVAEVTYAYTSKLHLPKIVTPIGELELSPTQPGNLQQTIYARPRRSAKVTLN